MNRSSVLEIHTIDDYIPYYHTRIYLRTKKKESGRSIPELMDAVNITNEERFQNQSLNWHDCRGRIPHSYLGAIGADLATLEFTVELDQELFDRALQLPVMVHSYVKGKMPGFYRQYEFPEPAEYENVIDFLLDKSIDDSAHYFIKVAGLKLVDIHRGEIVNETFFRPGLWNSRNWIVFKDQGHNPF